MPSSRPIVNAFDSSERLEEVERLAGVGTAVWNFLDDTVDVSAQGRRNFDFPPDQPLKYGMLATRIHPDDRVRTQAMIDEAMRTGRRIAYEHRVVHRSGEIRHMASTFQVFLQDGKPTHAFGTSQDVTALRVAEQTLARDGRRLAEAERMADLGSWEMELGSGTVTWSEQLFRMYGVDPGTTMPSFEAFRRLLHPDDETEVVRIITEGIAAAKAVEYDCRVVRADGEVRVFHQRNHVMCDASGTPVRAVGTVQDVTERHREHAALLRLKAIVQSSMDAIIGLALDGTVESWNQGAERATGWSADEMIGRPISDLVAPEAGLQPSGLMDRVGRGEHVHDAPGTILTRDGRRVEVVVSGWPIRDGSGRVVGASIIARHGLPGDRARAAGPPPAQG